MKRLTSIAAAIIVVVAIASVGAFAFIYYGSGTLRIEITDPPTDWGEVTQIYLSYSAIEIHRVDAGNESGWTTVIDTGGSINLTSTLNVSQLVGSKNLQAGIYNQIRFNIDEANVTVDGQNYTATVPSDVLKVLIPEGGIEVTSGQTSTLLIELDIVVKGSKETTFRIVPAVKAAPA